MFSSLPGGTKLIVVGVMTLSLASCSRGRHPSSAPPPTDPVLSKPAAIPSTPPTHEEGPSADNIEDRILPAVSAALRRARLITKADLCYAYQFDPGAGRQMYSVDVSENHRHPECGGDPQTQPHLFTVLVDKKTNAMSQDATTPGDFQPMNP